MENNNKYSELVKTLNKHNHNYYVLDNPTVSDAEYDRLFSELLTIEKETGYVSDNSPSRKVGGEPLSCFSQHTHLQRLYSLDKAQSFSELRAWHNRVLKLLGHKPRMSVELKHDGLTLCLTYEDGRFVRATTRGDGETGEDVTAQVLTIKSLPLTVSEKTKLEIQGEGVMRLSRFSEYNKTALKPLSNPRNGAAGAIRSLDPKVTASRKLDVVCYNLNYSEQPLFSSQKEIAEFLAEEGFLNTKVFFSADIDEIIDYISAVDRGALDFLIDGMVIKVDSLSAREKLGFTDRFPRWAVAYKFEAEEVSTILLDVEWNVGRSGKITPLAHLSPVELSGATVSRATLNNMSDIKRKGVKKGSRVFVRRSGDVIPEIMGVAEFHDTDTEITPPETCPDCGSGITETGAHLFCQNTKGCPSRIISALEYFAGKDCMDIEGFSSATAKELYLRLKLTSPHEIYGLTENDLYMLDGFKDKKVRNLLTAIEKSKTVSLDRFICALGIPNIGKKTARDLAGVFGDINTLSSATVEQLLGIPEVGGIMAESITEYFRENADFVQNLLNAGLSPSALEVKSQKFLGKKFVITGTLEKFSRDEITALIEENGGKVTSSVSKTISYLVAGEETGSKLQKAQALGLPILSESEFLEMLENGI
jgi:DNA ligase (NAD+)